MNLALRSIFNLRAHRSAHCRVVILVDAASGIEPADVVRYLRPWGSWVSIAGAFAIGPALTPGLVESLAGGCDVVMLVSTSEAHAVAVRNACVNAKLAYVGPELPPQDSRELGLLQEVVHHDSELGGYNEWTRTDPQASPWVLRMLSSEHCRRQFPAYVVPHLEALFAANGGRALETIDIGCGALSRLRWGALSGFLRITGVDPLLDMYAVILERHGLSALPAIRLAREVRVGAEAMSRHVPPGACDFVYSSNALDHTEDPPAIVAAIGDALRPGGVVALEVFTREGSRENWWQLHQFDMYVDDAGRFVCESRDKRVTPLFPAGCAFDVIDIPVRHDTVTAVVARRR